MRLVLQKETVDQIVRQQTPMNRLMQMKRKHLMDPPGRARLADPGEPGELLPARGSRHWRLFQNVAMALILRPEVRGRVQLG